MTDLIREVLPPGGRIGFEVAAGQRVKIIDLEGQQVSDFISFNRLDQRERLAMYPSRAVARSWRLTKGHGLYSNLSNLMWTIEEDTVGENYCGGGFCNPYINEARYGAGDAPTCWANFEAALKPYGIGSEALDFDACLNIFMTVTYEPDGEWGIKEPRSKAGDWIQLAAEMDQIVAISNCPQLHNPVNAGSLKPIEVQVIEK